MRRRCAAVNGNFDGERTPCSQVFGYPRCEESGVGEQSDQETGLLGVSVNVEEIFSDKDLPTGVKQPQATFCGHLIQKPAVFFIGEFVAASIWIMKWKVVVAVKAGEVATPGDFDGAADGDSLRYDSLVKAQAPVLIALGFHVPTGYHTTRLRAKPQKRTVMY
jgi:hypothetical protein